MADEIRQRFNVKLYATPVDGSFSLFLPKESPDATPET